MTNIHGKIGIHTLKQKSKDQTHIEIRRDFIIAMILDTYSYFMADADIAFLISVINEFNNHTLLPILISRRHKSDFGKTFSRLNCSFSEFHFLNGH